METEGPSQVAPLFLVSWGPSGVVDQSRKPLHLLPVKTEGEHLSLFLKLLWKYLLRGRPHTPLVKIPVLTSFPLNSVTASSRVKHFLCSNVVTRMENNLLAHFKNKRALMFYLIFSAEDYSCVTDEKEGAI